MRFRSAIVCAAITALVAAAPLTSAQGQISNPPVGVSASDVQAAQSNASAALTAAQAAQTDASAARTAATGAVKSVQGVTPDANGAVVGIVRSVNSNGPDASGAVAVPTTNFIAGFTSSAPGTVASLMSSAPCNVSRVGSYAVVSDLYSAVTNSNTNEVLRCGQSGSLYYWRPQRTDYSATVPFTSGAMTLNPLMTPPVLYLTGTMTGNATITPSTTYAYPGQQFAITHTGTLGLFSVQIGGLLGGALSIVTGGTRIITYTCDTSGTCGWRGN